MTHATATKSMIPGGRGGKVLNVTLSPHHGLPGMAHSSSARAAVENLTRVLSIEWARFGIKVNALAAGHFATEALKKYPKPVYEGVARTVPLQRLGEPEEHAWLVTYLASRAGDYCTGAIFTMDGGRDNWFGPWPPVGLTDDAGKPLAEERRPAGLGRRLHARDRPWVRVSSRRAGGGAWSLRRLARRLEVSAALAEALVGFRARRERGTQRLLEWFAGARARAPRLRDWPRASWATAVTRGPQRAITRRF